MQFPRKQTSRGLIDYLKKNKYLLFVFIYCIVAALLSSRLIFEYGESKFYTAFFLGGFLLIVFLKVVSIATSSEKEK
jgi:fucose permease